MAYAEEQHDDLSPGADSDQSDRWSSSPPPPSTSLKKKKKDPPRARDARARACIQPLSYLLLIYIYTCYLLTSCLLISFVAGLPATFLAFPAASALWQRGSSRGGLPFYIVGLMAPPGLRGPRSVLLRSLAVPRSFLPALFLLGVPLSFHKTSYGGVPEKNSYGPSLLRSYRRWRFTFILCFLLRASRFLQPPSPFFQEGDYLPSPPPARTPVPRARARARAPALRCSAPARAPPRALFPGPAPAWRPSFSSFRARSPRGGGGAFQHSHSFLGCLPPAIYIYEPT